MTGAGDAAELPGSREVFIALLSFASCRLLKLPVLRSDPDWIEGTSGTLRVGRQELQPPFRSMQGVIINAPLEAVWSYSMDLAKIPEFHPRVVKVDLLSGLSPLALCPSSPLGGGDAGTPCGGDVLLVRWLLVPISTESA